MIQKLILENWRSHKHTEIEFTKGTNVIIGQMGSGKTSLMDAICFAFYGTFPSLQARKIKLDEIIKNKPEQEQKSKIILYFDINGENYSIKREIELKKSTKAELRKKGVQVAGPQSQRVTEEVSKILQVNYELYSRAVYAEQNNIDYFLEITKSQRKQKIDELLQISKFENAKKTLNQVINRLKEKASEKEKTKTTEEEIQKIPKIQQEVQQQEKELEEITQKQQEVKNKKIKVSENYEKIKKLKQEHEKISNLLKELTGKISYLEKEISKKNTPLKTEEETRKEYETIKKEKQEISTKKELKEKLEKQKETAEAIIKISEKKIDELSSKIAQIILPSNIEELKKQKKEAIKNYQEELNKSKGEILSKQEAIKEIKNTMHQVETNEKCPVCEAKLIPEKKNEIISIKKEKINEIKKQITQIEEKESRINEELNKLNKELEQIQIEEKKANEKTFFEQEKTQALKNKEENLIKLEEAGKKLKELKIEGNYEEIIEKEQALKKQLKYYELKKEIKKTNEEITKASQEKEKINYDEKLEKEVNEELKNTEIKIALLKQKKENTSKLINEKKERLEGLLKLKKEAEINKKQAKYLRNQIESFHTLQNVLQNTQAKLREEFIESTNMALKDIWEKIYPYGDYTELKLEIDDQGDYLLKLKTVNNKWVNADGITSGGERSSASLALRIAFSLVLTKNLSWLVLDEPTHNLDKQAISELAKTLKEHLPTLVEQIFLITHEPELEKASSKNIYRLERNKETEEETKVIVELTTS